MSSEVGNEETRIGPKSRRRVLVEGVLLGALYGIVLRGIIGNSAITQWITAHDRFGVSGIMTVSFLVLGPFIIGFLSVSRVEPKSPMTVLEWIYVPWFSVGLMMLATMLFSWEGFICVAMAMPIALVVASLGGVTAGVYMRKRRVSGTTLSCMAVLPFLIAPIEARLAVPDQTRTVASEIRIHASPETVWRNIERVPAIAPTELETNWTHRIGFPRPVEATLSFEGVGGVRHASFERGLMFIETVTAWEPEQRLAFSIKADSANIPTTTLDEHVTIGGRYFDVLDGEYSLEPLANGDVMLHLVSHQRLSTDFNGYAGLWTDAVMQNLQTSILKVIQHRCEHA